MRKIISCIVLLVCTTMAFAQRVKPTLPEPDTIRAGEYYYLWNEEAQKFAGKDYYNRYHKNYDTYNTILRLAESTYQFIAEGSKYYIRKNNGFYWYDYWIRSFYYGLRGDGSNKSSDGLFRLNKQEDGTYTIQRDYNYNAEHFVATHSVEEGHMIVSNVTDSTYIKWRLIPDSCALDVARMSLYLELEKIDSTFNVEPYDELLANSTSADELIEAAKEIQTMASTTNSYLLPDWSDYKIQFVNDDTYPWTYEYVSLRDYSTDKYYGGKFFKVPISLQNNGTSLKAIVDVDANEAVLVYEAFTYRNQYFSVDVDGDGNNEAYYDFRIDLCNELNVYIDGKLVRNIKKDQISNKYGSKHYPYDTDGRYCEKLTKGLHTIEWEYLGNGNSNYNNSYICNVGVVKLPTEISVSLLEPGSLGTEILAQVNSVLEVRKLKIKGEMNSEDWKTIDLITELFSLDLSEAVISEIPAEQFNSHPWLYEIKLPEGLTSIGEKAFYNSKVEEFDVPSTLTSIKPYAFQHSNLRKFNASNGLLQTVEVGAFANCRYLKDVSMPTGNMEKIGSNAFKECRHLENVSLSQNMIAIEGRAFYNCHRLRTLKLPEYLEEMGTYVFYLMDSLRSDIVFPKGMTSVPKYSFYDCPKVKRIIIPEGVVDVGLSAFAGCNDIEDLSLPNSLRNIDFYAFDGCYELESLDFPDSLLVIGKMAFSGLKARKIELPETLTNIYSLAFCNAKMDSIAVPENTVLGSDVFSDCDSLRYAELPTSFYYFNSAGIFSGCDNLNRIKLKSPTLVNGADGSFVYDKSKVTLVVPEYLVSSYKLDSYWYTYKDVEGFGTLEVDKWIIRNPVTLGATSRLQGSPSVDLHATNLTVNGETGMELNDFDMVLNTWSGYYTVGYSTKYYYNHYSSSSQILSSADIIVNGKLSLDYYTAANQWAYIALPFDIRVGDIQTNAQYAIRYYDGANRAANQSASGNWKNYTADDIIPAGTGFVYQTSKDVWNTFVAYENANKNRALAARDLVTPLDANTSETSAHRGWNLVGNPWMTYFNIHAVDFTAPITVYDQYYRKYQAYSIIDDNVALHPTQAFFVQCPDDIESITFPARGRQLTSVVTDQNGARSIKAMRRLADVEISMGDVSDKTRVVMNDRATLGYDYGSDAGKFFAEEEVLQLYTTDAEGYSYAINERPTDDCTVPLAYVAPTAGEYTLTMPRNQAGQVVLKDLLLDTETILTQTDYTFTTDAGTCTDRFQLLFASIGAMGIEGLQVMPEVNVTDGGIQANGPVQVYTTDGRLAAEGEGFLPLQRGFYVVRAQGESKKVVIK